MTIMMLSRSTSVASCFRSLRPLSILVARQSPTSLVLNNQTPHHRSIHTTLPKSVDRPTSFTNILADDTPPPIQISSVNYEGIHLEDGLILDSPALLLDGNVLLWDVPQSGTAWQGWTEEHFEALKVVVPKPEILLLGTGRNLTMPPPSLRQHLNKLGIQLEILDTKNACSTYNLLAEEGRRVAAALLPLIPRPWQRQTKA